MKKSILQIGIELDKKALQIINGGGFGCGSNDDNYCEDESDCEDPGGGMTFVPWMCIQRCCVIG
jgi:hypothetical protein